MNVTASNSLFNIPYWMGSGNIVSNLVGIVLYLVVVSITFSVFGYTVGWLERKIIARVQNRHGPTYVGMWGLLQNMADLVKLLAKEDVIPANADRMLFSTSLPLLLALSVFIILLIPYSPTLQSTNLGFGLLIIFTIMSFFPLLIFTAAFSSGNKFAEISAQRSVLVLLGYEIPILLVIAAIAAMSGGYNLSSIVGMQVGLHYLAFLMPIGFIIFYISMLAEFERPPFDLREADSELIAGWLTDVSAPSYALALFLDYARMFLGSVIMAILFFGGWNGPAFIPPFFMLVIKALLISFSVIIVRATTFRMRMDRALRLGWVFLIPLSLINIVITYLLFVK